MWLWGHTGAMSVVLSAVRRAIAPLTRTRFFRWLAPMALPPIERVLGRSRPALGNARPIIIRAEPHLT
ncbi:hypothetical protein CTB96_10795 [Cryobacterium arcticum]|uniref:Uncharacterized protein n=1 Tax=Cryobacterium arcticum TaxID=670052 RepID=A0A317ZL60_9MICO|nr:hypothetical protein CTB96_10795 [Cryobacterium arcticum]